MEPLCVNCTMAMGCIYWVYLDGRKYWRLRYWQAGKEKSLSAGVYPKVSLSDARKKRDEFRQQLQANLDPSAERKAVNLRKKMANMNSFEAIALEWYNKQYHTWVPSHAKDVKRRLENNIFPHLGKRPIDQINAPELLDAVRRIEVRGVRIPPVNLNGHEKIVFHSIMSGGLITTVILPFIFFMFKE